MGVDAGSISSSVRIKLDQLNADINACKTAFDQLGGNLAASAANYANITGKQYFAALKKIQTETDNITSAAKAGALTQQQANNRLIQLRQQELAILQKRAISEAGSNKATIAAIKETSAGLQKLIEKHNLLEKASVPAGSSMMNAFRNLQSVMQGPVAAAQAIISGIKSIASEADRLIMSAQESEKAQALLASTIAATGASAWTSKSKLNDYADTVSKTTLFESKAVTSMQAVLLGFKNIQGVNFDKASTEIMNMATVMGMDLKSAAQSVGKALDDPISGIDSLREQGFKFSEDQKKVLAAMVKTGDMAGAQNIILKELSTTYGGAATAAASTATGAYQNLKKALGELNEELGKNIAGSADWGKLGGFVNNISTSLGGARQAKDVVELFNKIAELRGARGFVESSIAKQDAELAKFDVTVRDVTDAIENLRKQKKEWDTAGGIAIAAVSGKNIPEMKKQIDAQIIALEKNKKTAEYIEGIKKKGAENAEAERKATEASDAEQVARIVALAEEKKKADEQEKAASAEKIKARQEELKAFSDAMEKSRDRYKETEKQIQLLGKTEKEQQEQKRKWEIEAIQRANISDEQKAAEIAKMNVLYKKQDELAQADANKKLAASAQDYQDKLDALNGVVKDQIEVERERAMKLIDASGGSDEAIKESKKVVNEYFDKLAEAKGPAEFEKNMKNVSSVVGKVADFIKDALGSVDDMVQATYDKMIEAAEEAAKAQEEVMDARHEAETEALDEEYQHKLELLENDGLTREAYLNKQVADAIAAGDAEAQAEAQKELLKFQTQEEYAAKQKALEDQQAIEDTAREKQAAYEQASIEYRAALASWKIKLAIAMSNAAALAIQGFLTQPFVPAGLIAGATATTIGGLQVGAVAKARPTAPTLATGGIILPRAGGVPVIAAENGYPELALNTGPSGQALLQDFADRIVAGMGSAGKQTQNVFPITLIGSPDAYRELYRKIISYGAVIETARRGKNAR